MMKSEVMVMLKKRLFAGLLTAAMLLAVLPIGAAALESSYTSPNGTTVTVEKLNLPDNTYYMGDGVFYRDEGGVRYLYDKTGAQLGQVSTTDTYFDNFTDGLCRVRMFNIYTAQQGYGFIDKTGQLVIPADYTQINEFSDGYALFMSSGKFGYIDKPGSVALEPKYISATDFHDGYALVSYQTPSNCGSPNNYVAIIDKNGNEVWKSPTVKESDGFGGSFDMSLYSPTMFSLVCDGKVVLYADSESGHSELVLAGIDGTIQDLPEVLCENDPQYVGNDRFWVTISSRPGLYNSAGDQIFPHQYFYYSIRRDDEHGVAFVGENTDAYIMDYDGNVILPAGELKPAAFCDGACMTRPDDNYPFQNYLVTVSGGSASATEPTQPAEPDEPAYSDEPSSWAKAEVGEAIGLGLVPEALQSEYTRPITRAEFCSLGVALYERSSGEITERAEFSDTDDVNVQKLAGLGIVNGVGGGKFNPDASITRQEAAAMLSRLAEAMGSAIDSAAPDFTDSGDIAGWASEAVGQMQSSGIMNGVDGGRFDPAGSYTREQSIMTIVRMLDIL